MLWHLIITVCLSSTPQACKEVSYFYPQDRLTRSNCLRVAEGLGDDWVAENPKYKLTKYKCTTTKEV